MLLETLLTPVAVLALVAGAVVLLHLHLDERRRPWAFVAVFLALFVLAFAQDMGSVDALGEKDLASGLAGAAMAALSSIGRAALSFFAGLEFTPLPDGAEGADLGAWAASHPIEMALHALFQLLSIVAMALTAEFALALVTGASARLRVRRGSFDGVLLVLASDEMAAQARSFYADAQKLGGADGTRGAGTLPPAILFLESAPDGAGPGATLTVGSATGPIEHEELAACLSEALAPRRTHPQGSRLSVLVFRHGRVSVTNYPAGALADAGRADLAALLDGGHPACAETQADHYSHSIEELRARQLVGLLLPSGRGAEKDPDLGLGLGTRPLNALVTGDDLDRVVLTVTQLVRNGQALAAARADGSAEAALPRISVGGAQAARVERRLRSACPALFAEGAGAELTPPARLAFFSSKTEMFERVPLDLGDLTLIVQTNADQGGAPAQREAWGRVLTRRLPGIDPVFAQLDALDEPGLVYEDQGGDRERAPFEGAKRLLLYGSSSVCMSADALLHSALDRRAMMVNLRYCTNKRPSLFDAQKNAAHLAEAQRLWAACSPYDRGSSRASADFLPAERVLWTRGVGELAGAGAGAEDASALRGAIGYLEHLRWNAYLVTSGYVTLPREELREALLAVLEAAEADGAAIEPKKLFKRARMDARLRRHVALVDWDVLPAVDDAVAALAQDARIRDTFEAAGGLDVLLSQTPYQVVDQNIVDDLLS